MLGNSSAADLIDEALKRRGRVAQAEVHDGRFVRSSACLEGSLVFITLFHANVVVALSDVEFGIELGPSQISNYVRYER